MRHIRSCCLMYIQLYFFTFILSLLLAQCMHPRTKSTTPEPSTWASLPRDTRTLELVSPTPLPRVTWTLAPAQRCPSRGLHRQHLKTHFVAEPQSPFSLPGAFTLDVTHPYYARVRTAVIAVGIMDAKAPLGARGDGGRSTGKRSARSKSAVE